MSSDRQETHSLCFLLPVSAPAPPQLLPPPGGPHPDKQPHHFSLIVANRATLSLSPPITRHAPALPPLIVRWPRSLHDTAVAEAPEGRGGAWQLQGTTALATCMAPARARCPCKAEVAHGGLGRAVAPTRASRQPRQGSGGSGLCFSVPG